MLGNLNRTITQNKLKLKTFFDLVLIFLPLFNCQFAIFLIDLGSGYFLDADYGLSRKFQNDVI